MNKIIRKGIFFVLAVSLGLFIFGVPQSTFSMDLSINYFLNNNYQSSLIGDDAFTSVDSMSINDIQNFLVTKNSFLKDYSENGRSAAQIIWDAAHGNTVDSRSNGWKPAGHPDFPDINQATGTVSPRIILVMLQKEQSLISRTTINTDALKWAMGYGCPDGGGCDQSKAGFSKQVDWAAWQLRFNWYRASDYGFGDYQIGQNTVFNDYGNDYNVTYSNRSTAAVYRYTPHVFDSGYNFWMFYKSFFDPEAYLRVSPGGIVRINANNLITNCESENCILKYPENTPLVMQAQNTGEAEFISWDNCPSASGGTCNVNINDGKSINANYKYSLDKNFTFTNGPGNWGVDNSEVVTGDFNGEGKGDFAALYDYGNNNMGIWTFESTGSSFTQNLRYLSGAGNWSMSNSKKIMVGDFNGDGKSDIAVMYDYGNSNMGIWTFESTGSSFTQNLRYLSGAGNWSINSSEVVAGDFNGDGKSDIGALYNYGNNNAGIWVFESNPIAFTQNLRYLSGPGNWSFGNSKKLTVGDFNGDGKSDIAVMYDYGNNNMGLWSFDSTGSSFNQTLRYLSGAGNWSIGNSKKVMVGDFNGDGKSDIAVMYDYGNNNMRIWIFKSGDSVFAKESWYYSGPNNWSVDMSKKTEAADFNGDGKSEISAMYDYGNNTMSIWSFVKSGYMYTKGL